MTFSELTFGETPANRPEPPDHLMLCILYNHKPARYMRFSTCRPGKTNGNFKTNFGTGHYVGETYKRAKFG